MGNFYIDSYIYMDRVMSHESHIGPTCGAETAQEEKAGIGLLLNGALVKDHFYLPT